MFPRRWLGFVLGVVLGRRLPITAGALRVPGLGGEVTIRRDRWGIPFIEAETEEDAWYALGFCQGQDRAFQLETLLRLTRGTLAEMLGPAALAMDRLARRVGFRRCAEEQMAVLDPSTRLCLEAFARGVNSGIHLGCRRPAHEFALLRTRPTPYEAADALAGLKFSALAVSLWTAKLARFLVLREDGPAALRALGGDYPEWQPVTAPVGMPAGPAVDRLGQDIARLAAALGLDGGSNNWVLAGTRTATGRPLLANDPHLTPTVPPPWYLAHIRLPTWAVAGACYIGTPVIAAGHNEVAAWGLTAGMADNLDLFLEEMGPDGHSVREGDRFVVCQVRTEVFRIKGRAPVREEVLITPRGPIVSPALEGETGAVSLRATWMQPRPIAGLFDLYRARNFADFRRALEKWPLASLNMVYADTGGTIGWQLIGQVPQRAWGWGTMPLRGWDPAESALPEPIPFGQMPHLVNPARGWIATANNMPTLEGAGPYLGTDWVEGYRLARIARVLDSRHDWDIPSTQALQVDRLALPWREMRQVVLAAPVATAEGQEGLAWLRKWDGVLSPESPAAALYEFFLAEMSRRVVEAQAPRAAAWALGKAFNPLVGGAAFGARLSLLVRLLREQPPNWFPQPWPAEIAAALETAVRQLRERFGPRPQKWAWGRIRPLTLRHPLGVGPLLGRLLNLGPFPAGGDGTTVWQMGTPLAQVTANPTVTANLRLVLDVGHWEENRFVLAGGQSGNPASPHYDDMLALWQRGEGVTMAWSGQSVAQAARRTLRLLPATSDPSEK